MTSGATKAATAAFFEKNQFFGLDPANVLFFEQALIPALTFEGKVCSLKGKEDGGGKKQPKEQSSKQSMGEV